MLKIMWCFALSILILSVGGNNFSDAQQTAAAGKDRDLATMWLKDVRIEAQSIGSLFSDLSLSYDIPIGLELALNDDELMTYQIDFKKGTLADLLTQFVAQHDQYDWEIKDGVVNIFPKDNYRDVILDKLLEAEISSVVVKENTSCRALEESLVKTPEIKKILEDNGITHSGLNFSGGYFPQLGRHFSLAVSNMRLKSILNKVVKESPSAKIWLIKRYSNNQTFFIRLSARHEDFLPSNGKPVIPQLNAH
jgi:hypothetical protein